MSLRKDMEQTAIWLQRIAIAFLVPNLITYFLVAQGYIELTTARYLSLAFTCIQISLFSAHVAVTWTLTKNPESMYEQDNNAS